MQNQPPAGRPWFRMTSQTRMEAPPPPQPTQPTQPPPRLSRLPGFPIAATTATVPAAPPQARAAPPPPPATQPMPPSPPPPRRSPTPPHPYTQLEAPTPQEAQPPPQTQPLVSRLQETPTYGTVVPQSPTSSLPRIRVVASRSPTPPESPKVIKANSITPPPSPSLRAKQLQSSTPPVQPMLVPEPEPKYLPTSQPKSVITNNDDSNGHGKPIANERGEPQSQWNGPNSSKRENHSAATDGTPPVAMATSWKKKPSASRDDETGWKAITIAGENMGAYMELGSPLNRYSNKNQQYGYLQQSQVPSGLSKQVHGGDAVAKNGSSSNGSEKATGETSKARPMAVVANSNVQAINNSLVLSSSCVHHNPGIHVVLSSHQQAKNNSISGPVTPKSH